MWGTYPLKGSASVARLVPSREQRDKQRGRKPGELE